MSAVAELRAENEKLREYAREATKAITSLTVGGSEFFGRKIGGIYTADLPFCVQHVRERREADFRRFHEACKAKNAAEAQLETALTERDEWRASATEFKGLCEEWQARAEGLQKALAPLIAAYVALSGKQNDGFWNADAEPIVVTARRALSHTLTEEGKS